jgi:hypothetical protein
MRRLLFCLFLLGLGVSNATDQSSFVDLEVGGPPITKQVASPSEFVTNFKVLPGSASTNYIALEVLSTDDLDLFVSSSISPYENHFDYVSRVGGPYFLVLPIASNPYFASVKCTSNCAYEIRAMVVDEKRTVYG